jgi:triacylglycerol esterase/lipase EstA (alpha/beta hydrolase family)
MAQATEQEAQIANQEAQSPIFIVVPGIMGTELLVPGGNRTHRAWDTQKAALAKMGLYRGRRLNIQNSLNAGDLLSQGLYHIQVPGYGWLLRELTKVGDVYTFSYDWRYRVMYHTAPLARGILNLHNENPRRIILIGHSMGGLICKKAVEKYVGVEEAITKFIALAVPFDGSAVAVDRFLMDLDRRSTDAQLQKY